MKGISARAAVSAIVLCAPAAVLAATPPATGEPVIDEVLVTATRRPVDIGDITSAVSTVSREAAIDALVLTDALGSAAGVSVQQTTPGQGAAIIRGLKGSAVLHLVDGMRLNNAMFRNAPTQYLALVPTTAIERVEVLRGTPTSLYGSDAVGGVVQLVTRVPDFRSARTELAGELYAGFGTAELEKSIRGIVDAGNARLAASLSAEYLHTGDRRVGGGDRVGPSGYVSRAGRGVVVLTPDDDTRWLLDLHWLEQPATPRIDELVPGFGQALPSSSEFLFEPNSRFFARAGYRRADGALGLDWNLDLAWQRIDDDRTTRDFGSSERSREENSSSLAGLSASAGRVYDDGSWIVGIEAYRDRVSSARSVTDTATGAVETRPPRFPDGSDLALAAVYGNIGQRIAERHLLSGGLRVSGIDVSLAATAVSDAASVTTTDLAGDVGWLFDLGDRWQLVANAGIGFRAPNIFDLGTLGERPGNRFNVPNTALDSEHVVQLDTGVRYRSDRLTLEVVVYELDYDDRIVSVPTGLTTPGGRDVVTSVNAARTTIRGVEFAAAVLLGDSLTARALATWTRGDESVGGAAEPADRIPPLNGELALSWDAGKRLQVDGRMRFAAAQDRLAQRDVEDPRIDPDGTPGYAVFDVRAVLHAGHDWQIALGVENLLDKRYRVHGSGIDAPGRNVHLDVSWRYR